MLVQDIESQESDAFGVVTDRQGKIDLLKKYNSDINRNEYLPGDGIKFKASPSQGFIISKNYDLKNRAEALELIENCEALNPNYFYGLANDDAKITYMQESLAEGQDTSVDPSDRYVLFKDAEFEISTADFFRPTHARGYVEV